MKMVQYNNYLLHILCWTGTGQLKVLGQIQKYHDRGRIHLDKQQIQNFRDNLQFLQELLELYPQSQSKDMRGLAGRISNTAVEAEIVIDYHVVEQLRGAFVDETDKGLSAFRVALQEVVQEMKSIKEELLKMVNLGSPTIHHHRQVHHVPAVTSEVKSSRPNTSMVGAEEHMKRIIDKLTNHEQSLQVIPIVGMGGIGKTTLARCVYEDPRIVSRFDRRIWCTISQQYNVQQILQNILKGLLNEEFNQESRELGEKLHKSLFGLRYLIIMDDVWSVEAWDGLKVFFPQNGKGSRVLVTTRLLNVCVCLGSNEPYKMNLLDDDRSWDLFHHKVFDQRDCWTELKEIGKRIAKSCRGLPLTIVTIAGLLSKSDMSPVYWESVAQNVIQIVSTGDEDEHCSKILWLSYNNLPMPLKPCFLHFRIFPEDDEIRISQLMHSWIAEGIIKPILGRRIEDVAWEYLNDLVDRNLIFIRSRNLYGEITTCGVHDLLRELCLRESKEEDFVQLPRLHYGVFQPRMCFGDFSHGRKDLDVQVIFLDPGSSRPRIPMCHECVQKYSYIHRLRFIENLNSKSCAGDVLPTTVRCISHFHDVHASAAFPSILFLWNLQFLTVSGYGSEKLLSVIWEMPQLRYLEAFSINLPYPSTCQKKKTCPSEEVASVVVLEELQTLRIRSMRLTKEVTKRIPNLKELEFYGYAEDKYSLAKIALLHQLESLTISGMSCTTYPNSLRKLTLKRCHLSCKDMSVIGSMSNLQALKLFECSFEGYKWIPMEGEFPQLKVLEISECRLTRWEVEEDHCFPRLERLRLDHMRGLKDIPCGIAEISTLISIDVYYCNELLDASARLIREEQHNLGNESLQINVESMRKTIIKTVFVTSPLGRGFESDLVYSRMRKK